MKKPIQTRRKILGSLGAMAAIAMFKSASIVPRAAAKQEDIIGFKGRPILGLSDEQKYGFNHKLVKAASTAGKLKVRTRIFS